MRKISVRIAGALRVPPLPVLPGTPDSEAPRKLRNFVEEALEDPRGARPAQRNVLGGPGIAVDGRLVSADLADDPGLEFDAEGVDGKVRIKPNAAKAVLREADGVGLGLAENPGLEFDGNNGVRVKADAGGAIQRSADGVGLADGTADKQMLAWDHDPGEWDKILPDGVWNDVDLATGKLKHNAHENPDYGFGHEAFAQCIVRYAFDAQRHCIGWWDWEDSWIWNPAPGYTGGDPQL